MNENQSQTESLLDIVRAVDNETLLLPEFQRDFRWEMDQTHDLFDSLIRDIFIGTVIYGKPGFGLTLRTIDNRPRKGEGSRAKIPTRYYDRDELVRLSQTHNLRIILDGQQRITSLYRAMKGSDAVYLVLNPDLSAEKLIELSLEETLHEIAGEESEDGVSVRLSDAYAAEVKGWEEEELTAIFDGSAFAARFAADEPARKGYAKAYRRTVRKLADLYKKQKLVAFHLLDMTLEKFCVFFERSNSRGIQLNFIDILAAKLYRGFNLRKRLEECEEQLGFPPSREILVRTVAYLTAAQKKQTLTIDKKAILENLEPEDFDAHWDTVTRAYENTLDHLVAQHFVLHRRWLPSDNMVIPLMVFHTQVKGFDRVTEDQRRFIEFWFWSSVFANRYSMASNEVIIADSQALTQIVAGNRIERRDYFTKLRSLVTEPDDLFSYTKRTSAIYRGVLNLIGYPTKGLPDWRSAQRIDPEKELDDHHIYPRAYIGSHPTLDMDADEAAQLVDCVVNRTLIHKNLNQVIGKKPPQTYLSSLGKENPTLELALTDHLVPPELATDAGWNGTFRKFLDTRAAGIMGLIERFAIEPLKEMEARYGATTDGTDPRTPAARLAAGLRTPESAFVVPILMALDEFGGKGQVQTVIERVGKILVQLLNEYDRGTLKSDRSRPRWQNTAAFARQAMVDVGLLKKGSPHGTWEITEKGRKHLRAAKL